MGGREVATREGGVDRNTDGVSIAGEAGTSPPARVAWIETLKTSRDWAALTVATREGGVDRNNFSHEKVMALMESPPARVAWIETRSLA